MKTDIEQLIDEVISFAEEVFGDEEDKKLEDKPHADDPDHFPTADEARKVAASVNSSYRRYKRILSKEIRAAASSGCLEMVFDTKIPPKTDWKVVKNIFKFLNDYGYTFVIGHLADFFRNEDLPSDTKFCNTYALKIIWNQDEKGESTK